MVFLVLHTTWLKSIYILPGLSICEDYMVRGYADHWAVSTMELENLEGKLASDVVVDIWDAVCCP